MRKLTTDEQMWLDACISSSPYSTSKKYDSEGVNGTACGMYKYL